MLTVYVGFTETQKFEAVLLKQPSHNAWGFYLFNFSLEYWKYCLCCTHFIPMSAYTHRCVERNTQSCDLLHSVSTLGCILGRIWPYVLLLLHSHVRTQPFWEIWLQGMSKLIQHLVKLSFQKNTLFWFPKLKLKGSDPDSKSYRCIQGQMR